MSIEGFDVETYGVLEEYGLQPWRVAQDKAWLRSWAVASGPIPQVTAASTDKAVNEKLLRQLLNRWIKNGTVVATWNAAFEISWLAAYGLSDLVTKVRWLDGMLLWRHLENMPEYEVSSEKRRAFGLKDAVAEFYPDFAGYDDDVDFGGELLPLMHYNGVDALMTRQLTIMFYKWLEKYPRQLRCALIESHCLAMIGIANYTGLPVDRDNNLQLGSKLASKIYVLRDALREYDVDDTVLASPKKLAKVLFEDWGLTPIKHGKTGPSTDKESLLELAAFDPRAKLVQAYREAVGNRKKFAENVQKSCTYNEDERTHPLAKVFGTYTGRLTYASKQGRGKAERQTGFALHQMKRSKPYRKLISAPPGHKVVELDAAGQEFRWMAILSGDPIMQQLCLPGQDPHSYMGAQVGGRLYEEVREGAQTDPYLGRIRQLGKVANLSLQFRTSAKTLLKTGRIQHGMMDMDIKLAEKIHRTYRATYRMVPRYWEAQIAKIKHQLFVQTLAGRRVYVSKEMLRQYEWSVESTSINFPVQGTGGDQKYLAMSVIRPVLTEMEITFGFDLHDGLYFMVPDETVNVFIDTARELFDNLPYKKAWGIDVPIPLPWDVKVGDNWGDMIELKKGEHI